jgi:hypothetical protein
MGPNLCTDPSANMGRDFFPVFSVQSNAYIVIKIVSSNSADLKAPEADVPGE